MGRYKIILERILSKMGNAEWNDFGFTNMITGLWVPQNMRIYVNS
jgi:hypothetical protein